MKNLIEKSLVSLQKKGQIPDFKIPSVIIERAPQDFRGDYSSNIALTVKGQSKKKPFELADLIKKEIKGAGFLKKIETAKPGFINFFVSPEFLQNSLKEVLKEKQKFGSLVLGKGKSINVEFISANPTGPLTLGNGRGGFCGDVLANVLEKSGYKVTREYYVNDMGEQIRKLGHSVLGDSKAVYKGEYIKELRERIKGEDPEKVGEKASQEIMKSVIKPSIKKMGIEFDVWFSEKSLHKGEVEKVLSFLKEKGHVYEKEGALWFNTTKFGDDKDRVLIRKNKEKTYFASDIAYLKNKFERGFDKLIFFLGADHAGYIKRMEAASQALEDDKEKLDFIVMQLVRLFQKGEKVKMSKRAGTYVTIDELIEEVGSDAARFFFLMRGPGSHLNFDLDLAKERSQKNPVYYVQYAHTRISSILRKSEMSFKGAGLGLLKEPSELALAKEIVRLPEIMEDIAKDYQVQRLTQYARDLADAFHKFYEDCQVLTKDQDLAKARLSLILAAKIALANALGVMGISLPEKM